MEQVYDKWMCPFCNTFATKEDKRGICMSRICCCGAIGIAAPSVDADEIIDDALNIFSAEIQEKSRGYDALLLQDIRQAGVEIRNGERADLGNGFWGQYTSMWFRRSRPEDSVEPCD